MGSISSIQFRGIDNVLTAYCNRKVAAWSIGHRSQMMFKYEGNDLAEGEKQLQEILEALQKDGSQAAYTLKVYESPIPGGKIKSNTPNDGEFNFVVDEETISGVGDRDLRNQVKTLRAELDQIKSGAVEPAGDSRLGLVREILELPGVAEALPLLVGKVFGDKAARVVSGVAEVVQQQHNGNDPAQDAKFDSIDHSVDELLPVVPDLDKVLAKLADVAHRDPNKVRNLVNMIDLL